MKCFEFQLAKYLQFCPPQFFCRVKYLQVNPNETFSLISPCYATSCRAKNGRTNQHCCTKSSDWTTKKLSPTFPCAHPVITTSASTTIPIPTTCMGNKTNYGTMRTLPPPMFIRGCCQRMLVCTIMCLYEHPCVTRMENNSRNTYLFLGSSIIVSSNKVKRSESHFMSCSNSIIQLQPQ